MFFISKFLSKYIQAYKCLQNYTVIFNCSFETIIVALSYINNAGTPEKILVKNTHTFLARGPCKNWRRAASQREPSYKVVWVKICTNPDRNGLNNKKMDVLFKF